MMARSRHKPRAQGRIAQPSAGISNERSSWLARARWWVIAVFTVTVPLFVSLHGDDTFRLPKELWLRTAAIVIAALILASFIRGENSFRALARDRRVSAAILLVVVVAVLATLVSTNRPLSLIGLGYSLSLVIVFCAMYEGAGERSLRIAVTLGAFPGVLSAVIAVGQRLRWWSIFEFPEIVPARERVTALIGNPNDVGACLAVSAIAVIAFAMATRKPIAIAVSALLLAGVFAADALTSMIAVIVSGLVMTWLLPRRAAATGMLAVLVVSLVAFTALPPLRGRIQTIAHAARVHDYDTLSSHRVIAFVAAWNMFRDHPLLGAGPGTFKWHYLPYRLRAELRHPEYYLRIVQNLGEAHNDHLQVLAEEGALGYATLLFSMFAAASRTWTSRNRRSETDERARFAYYAALPLAVCFAVLALAGFPLELPAVMTPLLFFIACILRWSGHAVAR